MPDRPVTPEPRMPQPEQWLSEHDPWATLIIVLAPFLVVLAILILGWLR